MNAWPRKPGRDRVAIIAEILDMTRDGMLKTNIMQRARLSYLLLSRYLELMVDNKLLDEVLLNDKLVLKATDRGLKFLYHCHEIMGLLETDDDRYETYRKIQLFPKVLSGSLSNVS